MSKKIILFSAVIVVIVATGLVWWRWVPKQSPKYTGPVEEIRLASSKAGLDLSSLIWIADDQGYFKDQGLDVKITQEDTGPIAQEKVASGNADIAVTSDFAFVSDSFNINNLRILASIDHAKIMEILARRDSGISKPTDLKGKKIGVTSKTIGEFFLGQFLIFNNIAWSEVSVVNIPLTDMQEAIISGKVDAVVSNDPVLLNIKTVLGGNGIDWLAQGNQDVSWLVVSNDQFLKIHPKVAERFLTSILLAENFEKTNPEKSKQIVIDRFKLEQNYFAQDWPKHTFGLSLTQSLLVNMENEARWRIENNLTDKTIVPNYIDFIYSDALRKVKLDAVTLY